MKSYKFIIEGKVQKVSYRKHVSANAQAKSFKGYVKNLKNSNVEACISISDEDEISVFLDILQKGSPRSSVKNISYTECEGIEEDSFTIKY